MSFARKGFPLHVFGITIMPFFLSGLKILLIRALSGLSGIPHEMRSRKVPRTKKAKERAPGILE